MNRIEGAAAIAALTPLELFQPTNPVSCDSAGAAEATVHLARAVGLGQAARRAIAATAETVKWRGFDGGFAGSDAFLPADRTGLADMSAAELTAVRTNG